MIDPETQWIQTRFAVGANVQLVPADQGEVRANIGDGWLEGRQAKSVWFKKSPLTGDATDVVVAGSVVTLTYEGDDDQERYLIGSIEERHDDLEVISPGSPLGSALLGSAVGDVVGFEAPNGSTLRVEVIDIA